MVRGPAKLFTLASVALLSCRAVLGIEEIEEGTPDGGGAGTDAAADSVQTDSATEAATDTGVDTGCAKGPSCNVCCREPYKGVGGTLPELEKVAKAAGCICGAGNCNTECPELCGDAGGQPQPTCIQCLDTELVNGTLPACGKALDDCVKNATCAPVGSCLKGCKP
jgi:hypothetical protein